MTARRLLSVLAVAALLVVAAAASGAQAKPKFASCHAFDLETIPTATANMLCKHCVSSSGKGEHFSLFKPLKGFKAPHECAWDSKTNECTRKTKAVAGKSHVATTAAACATLAPEVVNDLDTTATKGKEAVPDFIEDMELRIDPDSLRNYARAERGTVFVTFVAMPEEEFKPAADDGGVTPADFHPDTDTCKYPAGTVFLAPGTAREKDAGKYTSFVLDRANLPKVGGKVQNALLPVLQPHGDLIHLLCGAENNPKYRFVGGAMFKDIDGPHKNSYRWTSNQVNTAHNRWMVTNKQHKWTVPPALQKRWNRDIDALLLEGAKTLGMSKAEVHRMRDDEARAHGHLRDQPKLKGGRLSV